jgi:YVTN family beta-propeller protein
VDAATGEVVATIDVGPGPRFLAVGEGGVWVMNQTDGTISRVDPTTDTVIATIDSGAQIFGGDIAVGGGSVWVRGGPELLARIDPATNLVTERYGPDAGSGSVAADDDAVWVTAHDVSMIWRLPLH